MAVRRAVWVASLGRHLHGRDNEEIWFNFQPDRAGGKCEYNERTMRQPQRTSRWRGDRAPKPHPLAGMCQKQMSTLLALHVVML